MKYIGQYVYDLIARFRGDVYINSEIFLQQGHVVSGGYAASSTDHRILYMDSDGKVEHSADLEYDSANEKLTIGDIDSGYAYIARTPRVAGESNGVGGNFSLHAGQSTGSGIGGKVELGTSTAGSSGTSLNSITEKLTLWPINNVSGFAGDGAAFGGLTNPDYTQVTMPVSLGIYADASGDLGSQPHIVFGPRTNTAQPKSTKLSEIESKGNNSAQELISYSLLRTQTGGGGNNDDTDEHGIFDILVATSDGSTSALRNAFNAFGHATNNDVDVSLGYGATSIITIPGFLSLGGHSVNDIDLAGEFVDSDEHLMTSAAINDLIVAATSSTFVDLTSEVSGILPVANGGTGASSLTDNKLLTGTGTSAVTAEANATYDGTDLTLTSATSTKPILSIENTTADANAGELRLIGRRSADASIIAGAGDDAGTISFVGENAKTGPDPETITYGRVVSESSVVTDGGEMGKMTMSVGHNGSAIGGSLGFLDFMSSTASAFGETTTYGSGSLLSVTTFNSTITDFQSAASTAPIMSIRNYTNDATGGSMTFINSRGGTSLNAPNVNGDDLGKIRFAGFDSNAASAAGVTTTFAQILGEANEITNGSEEGKLTLSVASHDAELQPGLMMVSGNIEDEVDVTVGNGASSLVTVPGKLSIGARIDFDSTGITGIQTAAESFSDDDVSLMTSAAIDDRINAAAGASPASVSSGSQTSIGIQIARRTITQAEANSMHSTPIEIVPAQGANTVIIPLGGMIRIDRATTQSSSSTDWNMHYADQEPGTYLTTSIHHIRRFMYNEAGDRIYHITPGLAATEVAQNLTDDVNKAVEVSFDSAATTNAFTSIDVYLTYQVISIA